MTFASSVTRVAACQWEGVGIALSPSSGLTITPYSNLLHLYEMISLLVFLTLESELMKIQCITLQVDVWMIILFSWMVGPTFGLFLWYYADTYRERLLQRTSRVTIVTSLSIA